MLVIKVIQDEDLIYEVHAQKLMSKSDSGNDLYQIIDPEGYFQEVAERKDRPISNLVATIFEVIRQEDEDRWYREAEKEQSKKNDAKHLFAFNLVKQYMIKSVIEVDKYLTPTRDELKKKAPEKNDIEINSLFHTIRKEVRYHNALTNKPWRMGASLQEKLEEDEDNEELKAMQDFADDVHEQKKGGKI